MKKNDKNMKKNDYDKNMKKNDKNIYIFKNNVIFKKIIL